MRIKRAESADPARPLGPDKAWFNAIEFAWATADTIYAAAAATAHDFAADCDIDGDAFVKINTTIKAMFPSSITHFMGTYDYQVMLAAGNRVRFVIHNQTDLASGTRVPLTFTGISLEQYLDNPSAYANDHLLSILEAKTRQQTVGSEGGGIFEQTFVWDEQFLPQWARRQWFPPWPFGLPLVTLLP